MPFGTGLLQGDWQGRRKGEEALGCYPPQSRSDSFHEHNQSLGRSLTVRGAGVGRCSYLYCKGPGCHHEGIVGGSTAQSLVLYTPMGGSKGQ